MTPVHGVFLFGQWGVDGGLGLEFAMGRALALDLEGRYVGWLGDSAGLAPGALQFGGALALHF